jgi:hypothetical protein
MRDAADSERAGGSFKSKTPRPRSDSTNMIPACFERTLDLLAGALVHRQAALGFQALQRGECHKGLFGEHLLLPIEQGLRRPNLSAGDHS